MPIIDGEKWACTSCIKGHRVSGCTHGDRELHHINPKGRPVKQCEHCRGARRSKSQHNKCDCGERRDKGKHKDGEESRGGNSDHGRCACTRGAACLCGLRREVGEGRQHSGGVHKPQPAKNRPRLESSWTVFVNGHYKPSHRLNNAAHISGLPYRIPRSHTIHSTQLPHRPSLSFGHDRTGQKFGMPQSQRSPNKLPAATSTTALFSAADPTTAYHDTLFTSSLAGNLDGTTPSTGIVDLQLAGWPSNVGHAMSHFIGDSMVETRLPIPPIDWPLSASTVSSGGEFSNQDYITSPVSDYLLPSDADQPLSTPLDSAWSAFDLPLGGDPATSTSSQPASYSSESNRLSLPGLATSSYSQSEGSELHGNDRSGKDSVFPTQFCWDDKIDSQQAQSYPLGGACTNQEQTYVAPSVAVAGTHRSLEAESLFGPAFDFTLTATEISDGSRSFAGQTDGHKPGPGTTTPNGIEAFPPFNPTVTGFKDLDQEDAWTTFLDTGENHFNFAGVLVGTETSVSRPRTGSQVELNGIPAWIN